MSEVSSLGEFGLIHHLTKNIVTKNSSTLRGIGDDAAVLNYGHKRIVVSTDMLVEGIDFNFTYTPLKHLGYKSVVVNLSDIYAMNAIPKQITVALAFSAKFSVKAIEEIYDGIKLACEKYNIDLVGGDISSSLTGMTICITAIGEAAEDQLSYRNGAKPNDLIFVSGNFGAAYCGLQLLEREKAIFEKTGVQPKINNEFSYILQRQLKPEARRDIVDFFHKTKITPTSLIDVSDGLSSEILHICTASSVGCIIYEDKLPIDEETRRFAREINIDSTTCAMNGGEDYELLFTVPLTMHDRFQDYMQDIDIKLIGHTTNIANEYTLVSINGEKVPLVAQGWTQLNNNQ